MLAVGIVALNIVVALGIYFIDGNIDLPMIVGILYLSLIHISGITPPAITTISSRPNFLSSSIICGTNVLCPAANEEDVYKRQTLLEASRILSVDDELILRWKQVAEYLTDYPQDENGMMIGKDVP